MKKLIVAFICIFQFFGLSAQTIDYLTYDYKYLDENFQISIPSEVFQAGIAKYKFYPDMINSYRDSIAVVTMIEFDDWTKSRRADLALTYSWKRLGYHLWMDENEAEEFAKKFGFEHPWRMKVFLVDENNTNPDVELFFKKHRKQVAHSKIVKELINEVENEIPPERNYKAPDFMSLDRSSFLTQAFRYNPERIKDFEAINGKGCGKKNCCQTNKNVEPCKK